MEGLPSELQDDIMSRLSPVDLAACACVNKCWQTASENNAVWFDKYKTMVPKVKQITPKSIHLDAKKQLPAPPTWSRCGKWYLGPNKKDIRSWDALGRPCNVLQHYEQKTLEDMVCFLHYQSQIDYKQIVIQVLRDKVVTSMWTAQMAERRLRARDSMTMCKRRAQVLRLELDSLDEQENEMRRVAKVFAGSIRQRRSRLS